MGTGAVGGRSAQSACGAADGQRSPLDATAEKRLIAALKAGALAAGYDTDRWTLARVGELIETLTGQQYSESGVWRLLKRLGFSSQRPSGGARQRDAAAAIPSAVSPAPASNTIRARQTTFCGVFRSRTSRCNRSSSAALGAIRSIFLIGADPQVHTNL